MTLRLSAACAIGTAFLVAAYACAAQEGTGTIHFDLFWIGMLLFLIPCTLSLLLAGTPHRVTLTLIATLAVFDSLPKFLRSPGTLLFYDELAHYRQAEAVLATGRLLQANPLVPVLRVFPGLPGLSVALVQLTGLNLLQVAVVLLLSLHLLALLGVFSLAEATGATRRGAALAALLYSLHPGFLYFDAQYAYESLALVLFVWSVLCLARLQRAGTAQERRGWFGAALLLGSACVITHHVSSYMLTGYILLVAVLGTGGRRPQAGASQGQGAIALLALILLLETVGWTVTVASSVGTYLGPLVHQWIANGLALLERRSAQRTLFVASGTPWYERAAAFVTPPMLLALCAPAIWRLRYLLRTSESVTRGLALLGLCYFLSLPLMLTPGGNEAARRSWSFSFVGLAVTAAPALLARHDALLQHSRRRLSALIISGAVGIVAIGETAMNTNELYRFPGPVVIGADVRTQTAELLDAVQWFQRSVGRGQALIADRDDAVAFAAFGQDWTAPAWSGLPIWQFYLSPTGPTPALLHTVMRDHYHYLVVDSRISGSVPRIGFYTSAGEPQSRIRTVPAPPGIVARYADTPWASRLYQSDHLAIYRLDFLTAGYPVAHRQRAPEGKPVALQPVAADDAAPPRGAQ